MFICKRQNPHCTPIPSQHLHNSWPMLPEARLSSKTPISHLFKGHSEGGLPRTACNGFLQASMTKSLFSSSASPKLGNYTPAPAQKTPKTAQRTLHLFLNKCKFTLSLTKTLLHFCPGSVSTTDFLYPCALFVSPACPGGFYLCQVQTKLKHDSGKLKIPRNMWLLLYF